MPSLADLYLRGGQQQAQAVVSLADIAARARQQTAQNWGQTLAGIGQTVAAIPGQIQAEKDAAQVRELNTMRLDAARDERAASQQRSIDQQTINSILSQLTPTESGARILDRRTLQKAFADANIPLDLQASTLKALDAVDASLESAAKARQEHGQDFARRVLGSGVDLNDPNALSMAVALAKGNHLIDDDFIGELNKALAQGIEPAAILRQLAGEDKKAPMAVGPNSGVFDPNTNTWLVEPPKPEPPKKSLQRTEVMVNGKRTPANFDPADGSYYDARTGQKLDTFEAVPPQSSSGSTLSPYAESNITNRLVTQWITASKPAVELDRQVSLMDAGLKAAERGDMAQGAQAVLVTFQKILDPTSVVRESEYARSAAGQALLSRIQGAVERLQKGGAGVPLPELKKFAALAHDMAKAQGQYRDAVKARIGRTADHYKIPRELVFEDYVLPGQAPPDGQGATVDPLGILE